MKNLVDQLTAPLDRQVSSQLSRMLGTDRGRAAEMFHLVVPLVLAGLKRQKDRHGGMDRIEQVLNQFGGERVLDDLPDLFAAEFNGERVDASLAGLLGEAGYQAARMLGGRFGLDGGSAGRVIPMLAPVILGFLSRQRRQTGVGLCGIAAMLDRDIDDTILDDVDGFFADSAETGRDFG
jgi:hypothetical protein